MTIGIGTGSTVYWFILALAKRVEQGLHCKCVPTSNATDELAKKLGIPMFELNDVSKIDVTIDGADEIDEELRLIKGGGSALLQEKMVAAASDKLIIIADSGKLVKKLGAFPLPVEVIPYGWKQVQQRIQSVYNISALLRLISRTSSAVLCTSSCVMPAAGSSTSTNVREIPRCACCRAVWLRNKLRGSLPQSHPPRS